MERGGEGGEGKINSVINTRVRKLEKKYYSDQMPLLQLRSLNHI